MHIGVPGVPIHVGTDRQDVDIGASTMRCVGPRDQLRCNEYTAYDVSHQTGPLSESRSEDNPRSKYSDSIIQITDLMSGSLLNIETERRREGK